MKCSIFLVWQGFACHPFGSYLSSLGGADLIRFPYRLFNQFGRTPAYSIPDIIHAEWLAWLAAFDFAIENAGIIG